MCCLADQFSDLIQTHLMPVIDGRDEYQLADGKRPLFRDGLFRAVFRA